MIICIFASNPRFSYSSSRKVKFLKESILRSMLMLIVWASNPSRFLLLLMIYLQLIAVPVTATNLLVSSVSLAWQRLGVRLFDSKKADLGGKMLKKCGSVRLWRLEH